MKQFPTPILPDGNSPALDAKITEVDSSYKLADTSLTAKIRDNETKIGTNETKISDLDTKVTASETKIKTNETKISDLDTKVTASETKIGTNETKIADLGTKVTASETKIKTNETKIADLDTKVTANETKIAANKAAIDQANLDWRKAVGNAIAAWDPATPYLPGQITIQSGTFFKAINENQNKEPLADKAGNWSIFIPGSSSDIFANRSPTSTDVHPVGTKWWDQSFGSSTPLGFISIGKGAWQFLNEISLSRIRFYCYGYNTTYRSKLDAITFFDSTGTQIPNSSFVWGAASGLGKPSNGVSYTGQAITGGGNASGWAELEPSSVFDKSLSISSITGTLVYMNCTKIGFYYSNGGVKEYTFSGSGSLITCNPPLPCRYGDSVASVLGETLTADKLTDPNNLDPGRITGSSFTSAFNALYQAQPQVLAAYQQATIDDLIARIEALEQR